MTVRRLLMTTDAVGGVWRYAVDLAGGLRSFGIETTLLCFGPRPEGTRRAEAGQVADLQWVDLPLDWMSRDASDLAAVPDAIARHAAAASADVVQVNLPSQAAQLDLDVPVVAAAHSCVTSWFHAVRGSDLPESWQWQRTLTQAGLDRACAVIAPSRAFAEVLRDCYPGLPRITVVPNATAIKEAAPRKKPYAYAAARWWDEGKNAAVLDKAAARCRRPVRAAGANRGPNGHCVTFQHARHLGQLDQPQLVELAGSAAAFVSPSIYEPFGLAALEAARLGAALVLADIPTYRELWDGAALFAAPHDPDSFAAAIDVLLDDGDLRRSLSGRAASRAAAFTIEAQTAQMLGLYRSLAPCRETLGAA